MAIYSGIVPLKMVIFHSYVSLPEGTQKFQKKKQNALDVVGPSTVGYILGVLYRIMTIVIGDPKCLTILLDTSLNQGYGTRGPGCWTSFALVIPLKFLELIGGFLKWGYPQSSISIYRIFHYKPSILAVPLFQETSNWPCPPCSLHTVPPMFGDSTPGMMSQKSKNPQGTTDWFAG